MCVFKMYFWMECNILVSCSQLQTRQWRCLQCWSVWSLTWPRWKCCTGSSAQAWQRCPTARPTWCGHLTSSTPSTRPSWSTTAQGKHRNRLWVYLSGILIFMDVTSDKHNIQEHEQPYYFAVFWIIFHVTPTAVHRQILNFHAIITIKAWHYIYM